MHVPRPPVAGGGRLRLVLALVCAALTTFAQLYSPQGVLPEIAEDLGTSADTAALTISAATLGLAVAVMPWSFVGDRIGRRPAMIVAVVGATVLGLLAAWMPTLGLVLLVRLLQGVFLGGVPALAMAYLNDEVPARAAVVAAGWFVGGTTVGGLTGRIVATPVAELSSWRVGLTVVSLVGAAAAVAFVLLAPVERGFAPTHAGGAAPALRKVLLNIRDAPLLGLYFIAFLLMGASSRRTTTSPSASSPRPTSCRDGSSDSPSSPTSPGPSPCRGPASWPPATVGTR